ncbi:hypothetical protein CFC21_020157 [Triticum aestivum]|uniref:DUF4220 domain-containing protein n=2 Tax=Triticum aestivum TaxID=4565 RepID=A0A3B6B8H8_WHEAT|nr:uncharacterized protein LOC123186749 [Triticum aestivum]KAF7005003.1 hypothetical protein CFC21_020157 [Triticum aestivum]
MHAIEGLIKLINMWEIQPLVLLSFTLQIFLFFTGSLRQHSASMFLRLSIWAAYLGADFVAVYTLGLVSRHEDITIEGHIPGKTQSLAFFWAPFLLIHLGGQDTITAFAMEDNNLWLRHLLNLVVQAVLAIYVFWKSIGRHRVELLVSGVFLFVVGVIKYGERIWSLKCGCFKSLESGSGHRYKKLPDLECEEDTGQESNSKVSTDGGYDSIVYIALSSMPHVHDIFSGRGYFSIADFPARSMLDDNKEAIKMVSIILSVMFSDFYTKALVVRRRSAIILRCISQMSAVVAFAVFHENDKQRYRKIDIAITYSLFVGCFLLELCAMFISMMSPWTWAWLKVRKWDRLARLSWFIFSSNIGWPEEKQCFQKSMGQYIFSSWVTGSGQARTFNQRVMTMVKWLADLVRVERKNIFWISKLLDTEYVDVDEMTMDCVAKEISQLRHVGGPIKSGRDWPNLLGERADFGAAIVLFHVLTDKHLSRYPPSHPPDMEEFGMMEVCRKLSNYMMYLLATHPSLLPLNVSAEAMLDHLQDPQILHEDLLQDLEPSKEAVEELVQVWARLLIYAAGKSRGEMHTALLSSGGEFITFVWLLMALYDLGDFQWKRIRLTNAAFIDHRVEELFAFPVPAAIPPEEASSSKAHG